MNEYKCHFCDQCNGKACYGQMPGMGCPEGNYNFQLNVQEWDRLYSLLQNNLEFSQEKALENPAKIMLAPMTGGVENCGYQDERLFYHHMIKACCEANSVHGAGTESQTAPSILLSIGDGTPDCKLQYGIEAILEQQKENKNCRAAVFLKPYPNQRLMERMDWAWNAASCFGVDIDSYNIATMRNLVHLEKKTPSQLMEIKKRANSQGLPFVIKGVFTQQDLDLIREVKPDAAYISNHGGRVDRPQGSTGKFLFDHGKEIKASCGQLWVDGGIRSKRDLLTATTLGADLVGIGRPFVTALCRGNGAIQELIKKFN